MKKIFIVGILLLAFLISSYGQRLLDKEISIHFRNETIEAALYKLIDQEEINLSFSNEILPPKLIKARFKKQKLDHILKGVLEGTSIGFESLENNLIILFRKDIPLSQQRFTISGFLEDAKTGERLISANIYDRRSKKGTITNEYGFYSLTIYGGPVELSFSYLGYETVLYDFLLETDRRINITLLNDLTLEEILVIAADQDPEEEKDQISQDNLSITDIESLPNLAGESDLVRTTHLLPGVQTGTDGVGGIHIRGGNADHNLILIDGVPIYNISHAAGLFSIFNTSAINSARLSKGGFSARYGGRLSSVLDVHTKEGNKKEFKGRLDLGLLTGRLSLEGPLAKDKSSFFISGRYSYLNWYIRPYTRSLKESRGEAGSSGYQFLDVNAKINHTFSDKDKIYFSFYNGKDRFSNGGSISDTLTLPNQNTGENIYFRFDQSYREILDWGNTVAAFRWNHLYSDKLFGNTTLTFSRLAVNSDFRNSDSLVLLLNNQLIGKALDLARYQSGIEDFGLKLDYDYMPMAEHYLRFGFGMTKRNFTPGVLTLNESLEDIDVEGAIANDPIETMEFFAYLEDNISLSEQASINVGFRMATLNVPGKSYFSFQPRLSAFYNANEFLRLKASFSKMNQFLHLLSNSSIGLPTDLWVPATANIKPQSAWQIVAGMDYRFTDLFDFGIEAYFKKMDHLLAITEGASFYNDWEENVTDGEGRAYGLEFLLKKRMGKATGWLAYSISWADRRFNRINFGRRFPFKFDRRHDLKMVFSYQFNHWLEFTANWIFTSGFTYSFPLEQYDYELPGIPPIDVTIYDGKNDRRMPYYHRLDANFNLYFDTQKRSHIINVGIYNLYNRKNPLYYDLRTRIIVNEQNELEEEKEPVQVWLLPFLPSLNYTFKF